MMSVPLRTALTLSNIFVFTCAAVFLYYKLDSIKLSRRLPEWVQKQLALSLVFLCIYMTLMPFYPGVRPCYTVADFFGCVLLHFERSVVLVFLPGLIILNIRRWLEIRNVSLVNQHVTIIGAIFIMLTAINVFMRVYIGNVQGVALAWSFLFSMFISAMLSVLYLTLTHAKLAAKRKQFEKELQISRLNELKSKAELEALQAKINPHFLYNTLNSIAELSVSQGVKAREMTIALADLFRYSLNKRSESEVTIEEEIEMVENYLLIEKIRFEDKLAVEIIVAADVRQLIIPKFILQPIVENAIKHGIKDPDIKRVIRIIIGGDNQMLNVSVSDNGAPFPENIQMGYGLKNMTDKMAWLYPGRHTIFFENSPLKQVLISVTNPLKNAAVI